MAIRLVTAPTALPVTLAEAKAHLRVDHGDDDVMIDLYITAATSYLDGYNGILGRALMPQTWELSYDEFPSGVIKLPLSPIIEVTSVTYIDSNAATFTIDPVEYEVDVVSDDGWVVPGTGYSWPTALGTTNGMMVQFRAGYANGVPAAIKAAILLMTADMYERRETVVIGQTVNETSAAKTLLTPYRRLTL